MARGNRAAAQAVVDGPAEQAEQADNVTPIKKTRRTLTPEERLAKAEQDVRDARAKLETADTKRLEEINEKLGKLREKRDDLVSKITSFEAEAEVINERQAARKTAAEAQG